MQINKINGESESEGAIMHQFHSRSIKSHARNINAIFENKLKKLRTKTIKKGAVAEKWEEVLLAVTRTEQAISNIYLSFKQLAKL